jgi:DNA-binding MarR family transcriptional regulator
VAAELERLGRAVKVVQWRHHRAMDVRLRELGSSIAQWDALRALHARPGASGHELAQLTFMSDQAFGALATRLEAKGLIERRAGHGRRLEHALTEEGDALRRAGHAIAAEVLEASFSPLDEADRESLLALLERVGGPASLDEAPAG